VSLDKDRVKITLRAAYGKPYLLVKRLFHPFYETHVIWEELWGKALIQASIAQGLKILRTARACKPKNSR
jgi:hypothetical protein